MTRKRGRTIPYAEWVAGMHGYQWACVPCYIAAVRGERRSVPVYKTPLWAERHATSHDHLLEHVSWFAERPRLGLDAA